MCVRNIGRCLGRVKNTFRRMGIPKDLVKTEVISDQGRTAQEFKAEVRAFAKERGLWRSHGFAYRGWDIIRVTSESFGHMVLASLLLEERGRQMSTFEALTMHEGPFFGPIAFDTCTPVIASDYFGYPPEVACRFRMRSSPRDPSEPYEPLLRPCSILSQWPGILARCISYGWYRNVAPDLPGPPMSWIKWCVSGLFGTCGFCLRPLSPIKQVGVVYCRDCWKIAQMDHVAHAPRLLNGLAAMLWETSEEHEDMRRFLQYGYEHVTITHRFDMARTAAASVIDCARAHGMNSMATHVEQLVKETTTTNIPLDVAQAHDIWGLLTAVNSEGCFCMSDSSVLTVVSGIWRKEDVGWCQPRSRDHCLIGKSKTPWFYNLNRTVRDTWQRHPSESLDYEVYKMLFLVGKTFAAWEIRRDRDPDPVTTETRLIPVTLTEGTVFHVPESTDRCVSAPVFRYRSDERGCTYDVMARIVQEYNAWAPWPTEQPNNAIPEEHIDYRRQQMPDVPYIRRRKKSSAGPKPIL